MRRRAFGPRPVAKTRRVRSARPVIISACAVAAALAGPDRGASQETRLAEAAERTIAALSSGDAQAYRSEYARGAQVFVAYGPTLEMDLDGFVSSVQEIELTPRALETTVLGAIAVTVGELEGSLRLPGGELVQGLWRYSETRVRRRGTWRIAQQLFSPLDQDVGAQVRAPPGERAEIEVPQDDPVTVPTEAAPDTLLGVVTPPVAANTEAPRVVVPVPTEATTDVPARDPAAPRRPARAQAREGDGAAGRIGREEPRRMPPLVALALSTSLSIDLDGRVEEQAWADAVPITDFTQQEPVQGDPASEDTEVRVVFDEDNLYISVIAYDDPEGILARQKERDASLFSDDRFSFILDTFLDGRTGYSFEINPAGAMVDGLLSGRGGGFRGGGRGGPPGGGGGFGGSSNAWDGIWEAHTARRPDGWSAEIRIPFRTLNFNPNLEAWGINFQRTIRRKNEEILWRGWRRNQGLRNPVFAGRLEGLRNLSQGLGLEAVPSSIASVRHVPCGDPSGCVAGYDATTFPADVSLDVNYSVTSSLRASASINTDFAEVEADRRQVNLTRFPLFFPERRDFFLEGSGVFSFAPGQRADPFYSRNIGLDARSGQQIPIQYGTRLTGQAGAYELGFYQIGTGDHTYFNTFSGQNQTIAREDFTVARVKRQIWEQSSIGAIYTRRSNATDATGSTFAGHTAGLDLALQTRSFLGDKNLSFGAWAVWNSDPQRLSENFTDSFGRLSARGAQLSYPNDIWSASVEYSEFGDDYDPAAGFVRRNNFRRVEPRVSWSPRPEGISWIRSFNFGARFAQRWTLSGSESGNVEEQQIDLNLFGINLESGDGINFSATRTHEYLDRSFPVSSNVTVEPGDYEWWEYQVFARTASYRRAGLFGSFTTGGFWDGDRTRASIGLSLRPMPGFNSRINVERNDVSMPLGDFAANVFSVETQWTPTPWVGFTNQLQYDDVSEIVGLFLRMRWIVNPGNDVYLVYTHNWQNFGGGILEDPDLRTLSTGGSIKLNYTYRF